MNDKYDKEWYNELITDYKVLSMEMEWQMKDGESIKINTMKDSHIKNCINMLKRNTPNGTRSGWIYIFEDVIMNRRSLKINKIKKNIEDQYLF